MRKKEEEGVEKRNTENKNTKKSWNDEGAVETAHWIW